MQNTDISRLKPDHKARYVNKIVAQYFKNDKKGDLPDFSSAYENNYARLLIGEKNVPNEIIEALYIYQKFFKKEVVEAFYIAGGKKGDIHDIFDIDLNVLDVYSNLFFDINTFSDRLDIHDYVYHYSPENGEDFGKEIKQNALENGLTYLKALYGGEEYEISRVDALKDTIKQSYLLLNTARQNTIESKASKEARQWASTMISSIEALPEAMEYAKEEETDFNIRLLGKDLTNTEDIDERNIISEPENS